ncbi:DNA helicase [Ranunculus cassubicifolius]
MVISAPTGSGKTVLFELCILRLLSRFLSKEEKFKFDAVTRYRIRNGGLGFFSDIGLLLIDEVHLLNDQRWASLEAIVSKIKMLSHNRDMHLSTLAHVLLVAVSATIPNIVDLGNF